jgi:hypothetical protein
MRSINDTAPSPAATGSDFATALISETASLRRLMAKREPRQPKALARNFVLNCHFRSTITAASFKRLDLGSQ